ncbi:SH3 domain-containing protein [Clostridium sp. OS1-26]|uniref:SH3 domain-containing protein n=1 Tax=Clostridium sp. OS1-26 TaxID=3070681 RepID=UPI0027DEB79D|nr:SH3 domain-containing protein [Clostridium sp. OS1-26]WML36332.1 SH3 domain-containing protein [Clostridium sp. OS1-26]
MLAFLFVLLIGFSLFVSYYFTNKVSNQRKQILLLKYQNNNLKHKTNSDSSLHTTIKYLNPNYSEGILKEDCNLYIAPLSNSAIINSLNQSTIIQIYDSAEINDELWYEISVLSEDRINSKGWIKSDYISFKDSI